MSPPAGTGVCQGNFAASVKKILPIYQCGTLAVAASNQGESPIHTDNLRFQPLDRPSTLGIIQIYT